MPLPQGAAPVGLGAAWALVNFRTPHVVPKSGWRREPVRSGELNTSARGPPEARFSAEARHAGPSRESQGQVCFILIFPPDSTQRTSAAGQRSETQGACGDVVTTSCLPPRGCDTKARDRMVDCPRACIFVPEASVTAPF